MQWMEWFSCSHSLSQSLLLNSYPCTDMHFVHACAFRFRLGSTLSIPLRASDSGSLPLSHYNLVRHIVIQYDTVPGRLTSFVLLCPGVGMRRVFKLFWSVFQHWPFLFPQSLSNFVAVFSFVCIMRWRRWVWFKCFQIDCQIEVVWFVSFVWRG